MASSTASAAPAKAHVAASGARARFPEQCEAVKLVLVTGVTGWIGGHVAAALLREGFNVRGTVRRGGGDGRPSAAALRKVAFLRAIADEPGSGDFSVVCADLVAPSADPAAVAAVEAGWRAAMEGVTHVQHVASPVPASGAPDHPDELIVPARDGTLNVLRAAKEAGTVRRVCLTSSVASVYTGHPERVQRGDVFTDADWSEPDRASDGHFPAYAQSKVIAEKAAWDWAGVDWRTTGVDGGAGGAGGSSDGKPPGVICEDGVCRLAPPAAAAGQFSLDSADATSAEKPRGAERELVTLLPVFVLGPLLTPSAQSSMVLLKRMLDGSMPLLLDMRNNFVDVRDVAAAHVLAMVHPDAPGKRLVLSKGAAQLHEVAAVLNTRTQERGVAVSSPTSYLPRWLARVVGIFDKQLRPIVPGLGVSKRISGERATRVLGMEYRPLEATLRDAVDTLVDQRVVEPRTSSTNTTLLVAGAAVAAALALAWARSS